MGMGMGMGMVLVGVDETDLRTHFDGRVLDERGLYPNMLYPNIWADPDVLDSSLMPNMRTLREFYASAAAAGQPVLICLL